ncbi:MAG: hypothetical protein EAZ91_15060 [Cytophagales bacterium]|nr:MAG: hypothetical protein EAZ91_15060 [Cytophagales bacterium]
MNLKLTLLLLSGLAFGCQSKQDNTAQSGDSTATTATATTETSTGNVQLLQNLPEAYNTPDGLALAPDSSVILSVCNFGNPSFPAALLRLEGDSLRFFFAPPALEETRHAGPMDLAYGPDGHLYYADNQYFYNRNYKSRLMRIRMQGGKPTKAEPVVTGLRLPNAIVWEGNTLYITDSQWDTPDRPRDSAILRFSLAEMSTGTPVKMTSGPADPHVFTTFTTGENESGIDNGCDGLDFDSKGNLYTGGFGDGILFKMTLKPDGSMANKTQIAKLACVDGLIVDRATDRLYVCDSKSNAIRIVTTEGAVSTLAENGDTDGANGLLDQPAEVLLRGRRLFISNYDLPEGKFKNQRFDAPHTMSYVDLK